MQTGALIVAAGMSSRMGNFKPLLNIGSISIAKRVVATFQQAGIDKIVMVTGYNATLLEHHLTGLGLVFLRNEQYETTHMFDSACIGLQYLQNKCDQLLFTPVDIPLFTAATVQALLASGAALACPVCQEQSGHPILISSRLIPSILSDSGEGGLKGALSRCKEPMVSVPVEDEGILHDADTPKDYRSLLQFHNAQLVRPVITVSLAREKTFFDPQAAMLLRLVQETQSVRAACQRMQLSYSSGWNLIRRLENELNRTLIERSQGGSGGGKSTLSADGEGLLARYEAFSSAVKEDAALRFQEYFGDLLP